MYFLSKQVEHGFISMMLVTAVFLFFIAFSGVALADDPLFPGWTCTPTSEHDVANTILIAFNSAVSPLFAKFPFSLLSWASNMFEGMSSISPVSPAEMSFDFVIFHDVHPFGFLTSGGAIDVVMQMFRWMMLVSVLLGLLKHVLERIL